MRRNLCYRLVGKRWGNVYRKPLFGLELGRLAFEIFDVISDSVPHGVANGIMLCGGTMLQGSRLLLRLPEGQHRHAIGIGNVIGIADSLDTILTIAEIDASNPAASVLALSVSQVKLRVDGAVIRLATDS